MLLTKLGTHRIQHSGRTLKQHLWGTFKILADNKYSQDICFAGLFHSIYGTNIFKTVTTTNRDTIKKAIGETAEQYVYMFSQLNRPACWTNNSIDLQYFDNLQAIETANLQEQQDLLARNNSVDFDKYILISD